MSKANLIINADQSVYHLGLRPEEMSDFIITVGDPSRVAIVSSYFDTIESRNSSREFVTHTGTFQKKRLTVISTGIGTDNIDIVLNELDALLNVELTSGIPKEKFTRMCIVRIGTSGAVREDIPLDSLLITQKAIGLDSLLHNYNRVPNEEEMDLRKQCTLCMPSLPLPYLAEADRSMLQHFHQGDDFIAGTTVTAPGFYGPQGRQLRIGIRYPELIRQISALRIKNSIVTNLEMETSGIYGLAGLMGHRSISCSAILANRVKDSFSNHAEQTIRRLIEICLQKIVSFDNS
ncbi:MAG: nucleoside phosphorylase [Saprospiraceae bacterium]